MCEDDLKEMYEGYVEALVWAEIPAGSEDDCRTLDELGFTIYDISPDAMTDIQTELQRFYDIMPTHYAIVPADAWNQVGMDLYFTRQGHGVGFWSRPEVYGKVNAQRLTELVEKNFSETYAWVEDGKIMVESYIPNTAGDY